MASYTNTNPGDVRRRVWRIGIDNPLAGDDIVVCHEEDAVLLADGTEKSLGGVGGLSKTPDDLNEVVELRDPTTDAVFGSTTVGAIYAAIYSLARHIQLQRDVAEAAP